MRVVDRSGRRVRVTAPGRVNLIGEHTDYMGGLVMPMAIDLATTVEATVGGVRIELRSDSQREPAVVALPCGHPAELSPAWARYLGAVAAELDTVSDPDRADPDCADPDCAEPHRAGPDRTGPAAVRRGVVGLTGTVTSTLPAGAGLSSSAALEVAAALALGANGTPAEVAALTQRAEHRATGVPTGIMDQLCIAAGRAGHALVIDCATLAIEEVAMPDAAAVWVVHSGEPRALAGSAYAERRASAEAAAAVVGPLPTADAAAIEAIVDPLLRRRARHVHSECARVLGFRDALRSGDLPAAGALMVASHRSLRDDFEVSTPGLDRLVHELCAIPGVYGARLTGAGFGGCVVALADPGITLDGGPLGDMRRWRVRPADGARIEVL